MSGPHFLLGLRQSLAVCHCIKQSNPPASFDGLPCLLLLSCTRTTDEHFRDLHLVSQTSVSSPLLSEPSPQLIFHFFF